MEQHRHIPNTYMRIFWRVLGADPRLLDGTEQTADSLAVLGGVHSLEDYAQFLSNAEALWPDTGVGLQLGALGRLVGVHGSLSVAALNSRTLGDTLSVIARFASQRNADIGVLLVDEPDWCGVAICFQRPYPLGRVSAVEIHLLAMQRMLLAVAGMVAPSFVVELDYPAPRHAERYPQTFLTDAVRFAQPRNALLLPRHMLDVVNELEIEDELRESAIQRLERNQRPDSRRSGVVAAVREILDNNPGRLWRVGEVADHLHMSPRSLQRKMAANGRSFQQLLDDSVMQQARHLLSQPQLSVESIATLLGYGDVSNFRQAFRRIHGCAPAAFRAGLKEEVPGG